MLHPAQTALNWIIRGMGDYLTLLTAVPLASFWPVRTRLHEVYSILASFPHSTSGHDRDNRHVLNAGICITPY
jgi:hypothetical protein